MAGADWVGDEAWAAFEIETEAWSIWDDWPRELSPYGYRADETEWEIRAIRVRRPDKTACWLEWRWDPTTEGILALRLEAEPAVSRERLMALLRGRELIVRVQHRTGRTPGWRAIPSAEFLALLRAARESRHGHGFDQEMIAGDLNISIDTLTRYMDAEGITWSDYQSGRWT
jgi:hypothetical protein